MTLATYMAGLEAVLDVPVAAVRFVNATAAAGPSILWRVASMTRLETLDVSPSRPVIEIECRARNCPGAQALAEDILERLATDGRLNRILDQYDEPDDRSQERGNYFSHVATCEIT